MANLLSTTVNGALSSSGRISVTYNTDRYQFNFNRTSASNWWVTNDSTALGLHVNNVGDKFYFSTAGDFYSDTNGWLSTALAAKQNASTAITTSNIGSQSVNYASSAGTAGQVSGVSVSATEINRLKTTLGVTGLPYSCDIVVEGDPNTYYPVHFIWGDQDVWRRIIIKRGYGEQAPWDPIGTGSHHGGLLLDWEGNFGGWGGADYSDRLRVFQESYTTICADMYIFTHSMGYVFMLRGGGAVYHIFSDQNIRGYHQDGVPDIAYDTNFLFYDHSITAYRVYAPAPVTAINSSRIDGLRTKKQSLLDGRYLRQGVDIGSITNISASNFMAANAFYLNGQSYYLNSTNGGIYTNARFETASNLVVQGNSYLGNGNGDEVHINDILRVGATDSGDAHFYFGEGSLAGSDYGSHWYWDSGYRFTWNTRNNGTDTALFYYDTNSLSYITWNRSHNIGANSIDYVGQLHFNGGTRFVANDTHYLNFKTDATDFGSIAVRDGNNTLKGYLGYYDANGFGLLNSSGSWGIRLNPGSAETFLYYAGDWRVQTVSGGAKISGNLYTDNNYGNGLVGLYASDRYQGVFAMGDSYKLAANGQSTGNLYGLAWTHTNVGGQSKTGLEHQLLVMNYGVTQTAIGAGIWTSGLITTTSYGTSANWNTAFGWGNHASAGYLTSYTETDTLATVTGRGATTASQVSFTKTDDHAISVGTIRGRAVGSQTGEFIQLYERVNIGGPNGWGAANTAAPSYGLSVYGGATIGYGNSGGLAVTGTLSATNFSGSSSGTNTGDQTNISGNAATATTAARATRANGNFYIDDNYGNSIVGVYTSTRYQGVFAMGDSYKLPADGTTTGNLYGLAWSHPNAGGVAGNLNTHGLLVMENGTFLAAISGSIRSRDDMRAPIFYDSADTAYYLDPNGSSYLSTLRVANASSGVSLHVGLGSNHGVYTADNDRKYLVVSAGYYPHMALVATNSNNSNHGAVFSFVGSEGGAARQWNLGISNTDPFVFSIGYNRSGDNNPHYGIGDGWHGDDNHHARLSIDRSGNTKIRGMLYVNGTSGGISTGSAVIHSGNIASQSVTYATTAGALTSMNISQFSNNSGYITSVPNLQYGGGDSLTGAGTATTWDPRPQGIYDRYVIGTHTGISLHGYPGYGGVRLYAAGYPTLASSVLRLEASDAVYTFGGLYSNGNAVIHAGNIGSQSVSYATSAGSATNATNSDNAGYLRTAYAGGQQLNPQVYFNNTIGLKAAMTGAWNVWSDTLWINGYSGGDVLQMCALHTMRNGTPRMAISVQESTATSYGTFYEFITSYNIASQTVASAGNATTAGGLAVHTGRNNEANKIVRTQENGYVFFGYINSSNGNENNNSNPDRVWGTNGSDDYLRTYRTSALSVAYAASAGDSTNLGGLSSSRYLYYRGYSTSGNFQTLQSTESIIRFDQVGAIDGWSNAPGGVYTYGGVLSLRGNSFGLQIYGSHTGDLVFKTQWDNDQYSGWRNIIHSANIGSQSVSYATTAGNAATATNVAWTGVTSRPTALSQFSNDLGNYGGWLTTGGKAADSELIDGIDSSRIVFGDGARASTYVSSMDDRDQKSGFFFKDNPTGQPFGDWWNWLTVAGNFWQSSNNYSFQISHAFHSDDAYIRRMTNGTAYSWRALITSGNIGSQSVNYATSAGSATSSTTATTANRLERYGVIYGNNWNDYYLNNRFIVASAHNATGTNKPDGAYNYGSTLSYYNSGEDHYQIYVTENSVNSNGKDRKMYYRSGWNGSWGGWRSVVDVYNSVCYIDAAVTATGDITAFSDGRVKENVETLEGALDKTLRLRGVSYNRTDIEDKSTKIGVIAQEILEVVPEVVSQDENGMYAVSYGNITALLIEAIKEQQKQIDELKEIINGLTK